MGELPDDAALLDAALEAFASRGYDGTSVRELARELGVSHNFVHQRVGSKERLWYAAVDHGFARLAADLASVELDPDDDDVDRLRAAVVRYVESMSARPALLRIINVEAMTPGPRLDYLYESYIDPVREFGATILRRLSDAGVVRSDSVALLYFLMTHGAAGPLALPGLGERFGDVVDPTDAEAVHRHAVAAVDVIFDGLRL
jgi:AcrR family transcriptional regulator